jgi:hypothetical protein
MKRIAAATAALIATLALAACGESDEEKAQNTVCDARASIESQVNDLKALPVSASSIPQATEGLQAILSDLSDIAGAQSDLSSDRREAAQNAVKTFGDDVRNAASDIASSGSASGAGEAVQSAAATLTKSLQDAFEPVDCD